MGEQISHQTPFGARLMTVKRIPSLHLVWEGRVVRWCWINFQCRGVLLIWIIVRQGPLRLQYLRDGVVLTFFLYSIYVTTRFRLKYCLKGPLNPNNQLSLVMFNIFTLKLIFP